MYVKYFFMQGMSWTKQTFITNWTLNKNNRSMSYSTAHLSFLLLTKIKYFCLELRQRPPRL